MARGIDTSAPTSVSDEVRRLRREDEAETYRVLVDGAVVDTVLGRDRAITALIDRRKEARRFGGSVTVLHRGLLSDHI